MFMSCSQSIQFKNYRCALRTRRLSSVVRIDVITNPHLLRRKRRIGHGAPCIPLAAAFYGKTLLCDQQPKWIIKNNFRPNNYIIAIARADHVVLMALDCYLLA